MSSKIYAPLCALGLILFLFFGWIVPSYAQSDVYRDNSAEIDFPTRIEFSLDYVGNTPLQSATLTFDIDKFNCTAVDTAVPIEIESNELAWTWEMVRSGNPPTGSDVGWYWELVDENGNVTTTPRQTVTLEDTRFQWRTITADRINLHWYEGDDVGPILLDSAVTALDRLENDMGIKLDTDVDIYIYGDANSMREAILYVQDWAGGVAYSDYNTILIGVRPNEAEGWGVTTVAHELAHLVLGQFGRSCVGGGRPTWLEEGLAQVAEGEPDAGALEDIEEGIENNSFAPIRSLNGSFPAHGSGAAAAYSQSYSIANYLLETHGSEKLQQLILLLAEGERYDDALTQIYGFNLDGLELEWRKSVGAAEREILPTLTPFSAEKVPTIPPIAAAEDVATPVSIPITTPPPAETKNPSPGLCGLGLLPVFGLALVSRRRKQENN